MCNMYTANPSLIPRLPEAYKTTKLSKCPNLGLGTCGMYVCTSIASILNHCIIHTVDRENSAVKTISRKPTAKIFKSIYAVMINEQACVHIPHLLK